MIPFGKKTQMRFILEMIIFRVDTCEFGQSLILQWTTIEFASESNLPTKIWKQKSDLKQNSRISNNYPMTFAKKKHKKKTREALTHQPWPQRLSSPDMASPWRIYPSDCKMSPGHHLRVSSNGGGFPNNHGFFSY